MKSGYYWVELYMEEGHWSSSKWIIGEYNDPQNEWYLVGHSGVYKEDDFLRIGDEIKSPYAG